MPTFRGLATLVDWSPSSSSYRLLIVAKKPGRDILDCLHLEKKIEMGINKTGGFVGSLVRLLGSDPNHPNT